MSQVETGPWCSSQTERSRAHGRKLILFKRGFSLQQELTSKYSWKFCGLITHRGEYIQERAKLGQRIGQTEEKALYQGGDRTGRSGIGKIDAEKSVWESTLKGLQWAQKNLANTEYKTGGLNAWGKRMCARLCRRSERRHRFLLKNSCVI